MTTVISSTIAVSAPVTVTVKDKLVQLGELVISGAKTTTALLEQIAAYTNAPLSEQSVIDWAIAGGAWREQYTRPRSLWQEVSRGKRSGGKPSCRWSLIGTLDNAGCLVLFEYKDKDKDDNLEDRLPIEQVAGLGRLCATVANRQSQEKAKAKAQESETLLRKASLEKTRERQEKELAETVYKQGQERLYETLARELQEMRSWQGNAPEVFPTFASLNAKLLAERNWHFALAMDSKKNHEIRNKYALWRSKRKEQLEEQLAKERKRTQQANAKNAILAQNFGSILTSIENETAKLPVSLKEAKASEMREVLQAIRYLLEKTH